ncbi:MAG: hypothetical protein U0228_26605 [Myxococcaceae bacterium]
MNARILALVLAVSSLGATCSPPPPPCSCGFSTIARGQELAGQLTGSDGTVVDVTLNVATNLKTTITFKRGDHTIVEAFDGTMGFGP